MLQSEILYIHLEEEEEEYTYFCVSYIIVISDRIRHILFNRVISNGHWPAAVGLSRVKITTDRAQYGRRTAPSWALTDF